MFRLLLEGTMDQVVIRKTTDVDDAFRRLGSPRTFRAARRELVLPSVGERTQKKITRLVHAHHFPYWSSTLSVDTEHPNQDGTMPAVVKIMGWNDEGGRVVMTAQCTLAYDPYGEHELIFVSAEAVATSKKGGSDAHRYVGKALIPLVENWWHHCLESRMLPQPQQR